MSYANDQSRHPTLLKPSEYRYLDNAHRRANHTFGYGHNVEDDGVAARS